jgi:hypothetical protein
VHPAAEPVPEEAPTRKNWVPSLGEPPPEEQTRKNWDRVLAEGPRRARVKIVMAALIGLLVTAIGIALLLMNS